MLFNKIVVPRLETHVSHACNLKCSNCNHFSNYPVKGTITLSQYKEWNEAWSQILLPKNYQLCGGEPTLNKDLVAICEAARKIWPQPPILLVSNGFFLERHPDLPYVLKDNKIKLVISVHHDSDEYIQKLDHINEVVESWRSKCTFDFQYRESYKNWKRTFKDDAYGNIVPFNDNDPSLSYKNCMSKEAKQIHEGKIYKCPPLAYLNLIKNKCVGDDWDFYLGYKPLSVDDTYHEMIDFFSKKHEPYCNMCAANPQNFHKSNPLYQIFLPTERPLK